MQVPIQHIYKPSHEGNGLLYAWFLSMHTRVDIILYSEKMGGELWLVVNRIYDALCRLEKMANFYDPASELAY
ncbi:MAG: FAD:protein FMN transferase, partial [Bacteroides sp.]|nr:FAD:protein FMN transferase [Bacteroides sp.]